MNGMNGWEQAAFSRLEGRVTQLERQAKAGAWWLIECGTPATYFCGDGDWCSNASHAHRFATKVEAEQRAATMTTMQPVRVCEHVWS